MLSHKDVRSKCIPSAKESKIRSVISLLESQLQESDTVIASFLIKIDSCEFEISAISKEETSLKFAFALSSAEFFDCDLAKPRSFSLTERGGEYEYWAFLDYQVNLLPFYGESFSLAVTERSTTPTKTRTTVVKTQADLLWTKDRTWTICFLKHFVTTLVCLHSNKIFKWWCIWAARDSRLDISLASSKMASNSGVRAFSIKKSSKMTQFFFSSDTFLSA